MVGLLIVVAMGGGIDDESAADVFPVRQSSEGGACSVAQAAVRLGSGRVLMAAVLLVTTTRWTVASLARSTPPPTLQD